MKKKAIEYISISCVLILILLLCSCGGEQATSSNQTENTTSSATESANNEIGTTVNTTDLYKNTTPSYLEETELKGIDISEYSGEIDFEKVKQDGISFVMVRLGGRGYGDTGVLYGDEKALEYIQNAKAAGLKVGGYFFSQAVSEEEAIEEADYAIETLNGETLDFPIAFDLEEIENDTARTDNLSDSVLTACAKAFCERIGEQGYIPMIYAKENVYKRYNKAELSEYDFWYAEYTDTLSVTDGYTMWQYSESGEVDGIEGTVDLNILFERNENNE